MISFGTLMVAVLSDHKK
ncbi:hypothetical protein [Virgibacillus necropolis]